MSCGVGRRHSLDPELLWLRCRLAATAQNESLAWEPPYASDVALEKTKKKKKNSHYDYKCLFSLTVLSILALCILSHNSLL